MNRIDLGAKIHQSLVAWGKGRRLPPAVPSWLVGPGDQGRVIVSAFNAGQTTGPLVYPPACTLAAYVPLLPGESRETILPQLETLIQHAAPGLNWPATHLPKIKCEGRQLEPTTLDFLDHPIHQAMARACQRITGAVPQRMPLATTSDLYMYTNRGRMPAVMFGPGELWRAHGIDECIDVDELAMATAIYASLAAHWCRGEMD